MSSPTLSSILAGTSPLLSATTNPFKALQLTILDDISGGSPSRPIKVTLFFFLGILLLSAVASLACLIARLRRGERWLYRLTLTSKGTLIIPNTLMHWLLWHSLFAITAIPYVISNLLLHPPPLVNPLWTGLKFIPPFLGLWHTAWGLCSSSYLFLHLSSETSTKRWFSMPAWMVSMFFVAGMFAGAPALMVAVGRLMVRFERGTAAWTKLEELLEVAGRKWVAGESGIVTLQDLKGIVLGGVPNFDELLQSMSDSFLNFQLPYNICASLATIGSIVTLIAATIQAKYLYAQLYRLDERTPTPSKSFRLSSLTSHQKTLSTPTSSTPRPTSSTSSLSTIPRTPAQIRRRLRLIIWISGMLCVSGLAYVSVCVTCDDWFGRTKIFGIMKDGNVHLYLYIFGLTSIDTIVVTLILIQTFNLALPSFLPGSSIIPSERASPHDSKQDGHFSRGAGSLLNASDTASSSKFGEFAVTFPPSPSEPTSPAPTYHSERSEKGFEDL